MLFKIERLKKLFLRLVIILIIAFIIFWCVSYMKCEIMTHKYGYEFTDLYKETGIIDDVCYFKVINYDDYNAAVYYVSKESGNIVCAKKSNNIWHLSEWSTVWSDSGSASGIIWLYII